jgi:hypothetical protein
MLERDQTANHMIHLENQYQILDGRLIGLEHKIRQLEALRTPIKALKDAQITDDGYYEIDHVIRHLRNEVYTAPSTPVAITQAIWLMHRQRTRIQELEATNKQLQK